MTKKQIWSIIILIFILLSGVVSFGIYRFSQKFSKIIQENQIKQHQYDPENLFSDQKVIELCYALKAGDLKKADELLKQGVDINFKGKDGMTPFLWLFKFSGLRDENIMKKSFQWLVKHKADPTVIYHWKGNAYYTVFHIAAENSDIFYLKTLLDSGLIKDIDMELPENANPTALLQAELAGRFENFKLLLDYGANPSKIIGEGNSATTTLELSSGNMGWRFAYELLKRGADFKFFPMADGKVSIVENAIEGFTFVPSVSLNYRGVDYRQKCVEFLENHGVKDIHPDMPDDEKYVKENGKYQLYILEKEGDKAGQWVKFEESSKYETPLTEEERKRGREEEEEYYSNLRHR